MPASALIYFGTYTRNSASQGIYTCLLDSTTGALSAPTLVAAVTDPSWITLTPDRRFLYAIHGAPIQSIGFAIDAATGALKPLPTNPPAGGANPPSHLVVDATGRVLLSANYRDGYISAVPIAADGSLGQPRVIRHEGHGPNPKRQEKPHAHSVTISPDNRFVIVADLGLDQVFTYALDPDTATLTSGPVPIVRTEPGAGPRHFAFGKTGRHGYVINEMGGNVTVFDYEPATGALQPKQTVSTLPADFTGEKWNAEVRVHPSGKFLYASNRTHDSLTAFAIDPNSGELALLQIISSGAKNPRNFAVSPDGKWLVCGHQETELVTVFSIDLATGKLTATPHTAPVASAVCVLFA